MSGEYDDGCLYNDRRLTLEQTKVTTTTVARHCHAIAKDNGGDATEANIHADGIATPRRARSCGRSAAPAKS
jgi:hypothetical protein